MKAQKRAMHTLIHFVRFLREDFLQASMVMLLAFAAIVLIFHLTGSDILDLASSSVSGVTAAVHTAASV
jgi:hypothetical protein